MIDYYGEQSELEQKCNRASEAYLAKENIEDALIAIIDLGLTMETMDSLEEEARRVHNRKRKALRVLYQDNRR